MSQPSRTPAARTHGAVPREQHWPAVDRAPREHAADSVLALQRRAGNNAVSTLLGSGVPMDSLLRTQMEARFGVDFSDVRIHNDDTAHDSATAFGAKAYTYSDHIVFDDGRYDPQGGEGKRLLAHELAHVIQQRRGGTLAPQQDGQGALEGAAQQAAQAAVTGSGPAAVSGASAVGVACEPDDKKKRKKRAIDPAVKAAASGWTLDQEVGGSPPLSSIKKRKELDQPPPPPLDPKMLATSRKQRNAKWKELAKAGRDTRIESEKNLSEAKRKRLIDSKQLTDTSSTKELSDNQYRKALNSERTAQKAADTTKYDALVRAQEPMTHEDMMNQIVSWRAFEQSVGVGAYDTKHDEYREARETAETHPGKPRLEKLETDVERLGKTIKRLKDKQKDATLTKKESKQLEGLEEERAVLRGRIQKLPAAKARNKADALQSQLRISSLVDPDDLSKESPGTLAGRGEHTFVIMQVIGQDGKILAVARGRNAGGLHAEDVALAEIEKQFKAQGGLKKLAGTRLEIVGDQVVCDERCFKTLRNFKKNRQLESVVAVVFRGITAEGEERAPRTTAQSATRRKAPVIVLEKEIETIVSEGDVRTARKQRSSNRQTSPPQLAASWTKSADEAAEPTPTSTTGVPGNIPAKPAAAPVPTHAAPSQTGGESKETEPQQTAPDVANMKAAVPSKPTAPPPQVPAKKTTSETEAEQTPEQAAPPQGMSKAAATKAKAQTTPGAAPQKTPSRVETPRGALKTSRSVQKEIGDKVKVSVERVMGATEKPFRVTTMISLNVGTGAGTEVQRRGSMSGNVSASARLTVSFSRLLSEVEKDRYLAAIGGAGGSSTDLKIVQLIASQTEGNDASALKMLESVRDAAYRSGGDVAKRPEGEFIEIDVEGDLSAGVGAGRGGISAHVQKSVGTGLRHRFMTIGGKESITVTRVDRSSFSLGGSAGVAGAGVGHTEHEGMSSEKSIEFLLDPTWPEYQQIRGEVLGATSIEQLEAIETAHRNRGKFVTGRTQRQEQSTGSDADIGSQGALTLRIKNSGTFAEGSEQRGGETFRSVSGSRTSGASVVVAGTEIEPSSTTGSTKVQVGPANTVEGVTQSERSQIDVTKSLTQLGAQAIANPAATLVAVAGGKKILQSRVDASGKVLDEASIAHIRALAENKAGWERAWGHELVGKNLPAWESTRQKVRDAGGDPYAISKALAEYEQGGAGRTGDVERAVGKAGAAFQFPDEIADLKPLYEDNVARDPMMRARRLLESGQKDAAIADLKDTHDQLGVMARRIREQQTAIRPAVLEEMQRRIYARRESIRNELQTLTGVGVEQAGPSPVATQADRAAVGQRIRDLVPLCLSNRDKERQVFARVEEKLQARYLSSDDYYKVRTAMDSLEPVYTEWDKSIEELKTLRAKLGLSPQFAMELAPDRNRFNELSRNPKLRRVNQ